MVELCLSIAPVMMITGTNRYQSDRHFTVSPLPIGPQPTTYNMFGITSTRMENIELTFGLMNDC